MHSHVAPYPAQIWFGQALFDSDFQRPKLLTNILSLDCGGHPSVRRHSSFFRINPERCGGEFFKCVTSPSSLLRPIASQSWCCLPELWIYISCLTPLLTFAFGTPSLLTLPKEQSPGYPSEERKDELKRCVTTVTHLGVRDPV